MLMLMLMLMLSVSVGLNIRLRRMLVLMLLFLLSIRLLLPVLSDNYMNRCDPMRPTNGESSLVRSRATATLIIPYGIVDLD